jgi:Haem-dependent oxidative N-demethylase, alpha subunit-like
MTDAILHDRLPQAPWLDPAAWRLPGVQPLGRDEWLIRDEVFDQQMRLCDRLIATRPDDVHSLMPEAAPAARECLALVLDTLASDPGYRIDASAVLRPDGQTVPIDSDNPLLTIGRLIQADVCLMQQRGDEHALTGAILCFPASWTLSEKIGRPLSAIHIPIPEYDADITRRVQRLFDAIRPEQPMWRANAILHHDPALFHPQSEQSPHATRQSGQAGTYLRSERQTLRRLPVTGAVVFTIHTYMIPVERLSDEQRAGLATAELKSA